MYDLALAWGMGHGAWGMEHGEMIADCGLRIANFGFEDSKLQAADLGCAIWDVRSNITLEI